MGIVPQVSASSLGKISAPICSVKLSQNFIIVYIDYRKINFMGPEYV